MSASQPAPWPVVIGGKCVIPAPDRASRQRLQSQAHNHAYRHQMVYRTRWDGEAVTVRRVA
jgi:hypothetical protein